MRNQITKHIIIGAGPAAICEIPHMLKKGVPGNNIIWIDPCFKVGNFGTTLSKGSSVPGNTKAGAYHRVMREIYQAVPACAPEGNHHFLIDTLAADFVCSIKTAAEPLQHITNKLRNIVNSIEGHVTDIFTTAEGFKLEIKLTNGMSHVIFAENVTLAIGAEPCTLTLPHEITLIDPNIAFIKTELAKYVKKNPSIQTVTVIGSSHSAALAVMHLLMAGLSVTQFMNKEYKYAAPAISADGKTYTLHDNTGLKGDVAIFTKKLLADIELNRGEYRGKLTRHIGKTSQEVDAYLKQNLLHCTHAVVCIGYATALTLKINNLPLSAFSHNNKTMAFNEIKNLKGIGIAFPQEIQSLSGEMELAVGVEKFWNTANN